MNFDRNIISKLYAVDPDKSLRLSRNLASNTPKVARNALRSTPGLTRQLLFVAEGKIGILSFPHLTADETNNLRLLGRYGDNAAILAPATISGDLLHQSFSTLIFKAVALKCAMPVLEQDPLELSAPPPSDDSPGPARLHVEFNEPENSPVIVALPATFAVLHYASWEDSRYSKGERTMKVKVKSCC
jgi:hypothetical protein